MRFRSFPIGGPISTRGSGGNTPCRVATHPAAQPFRAVRQNQAVAPSPSLKHHNTVTVGEVRAREAVSVLDPHDEHGRPFGRSTRHLSMAERFSQLRHLFEALEGMVRMMDQADRSAKALLRHYRRKKEQDTPPKR